VESHLFVRGRRGSAAERAAVARTFGRADAAMTRGARAPEDRPAAAALGPLGRFGPHVVQVHGLVSGRPLGEVSLHDFPSLEYADNRFIAGGLGAYLARLAHGLPVRLGTPATALDWSGPGVRIETAAGTLAVRAAILTLPMAVLQAGGLAVAPRLPTPVEEAVHAFVPGIYEHVVLHWPHHPFRGADRLAALLGARHEPPGLLTAIDGTPFHFFELDAPSRPASTAATRMPRRASHGRRSWSSSAPGPCAGSRSRPRPPGATTRIRAPPGPSCRRAAPGRASG
jgi:hypothetical protein